MNTFAKDSTLTNLLRSTLIGGSGERYAQPITFEALLPASSSQTSAINRELLFVTRTPQRLAPATGVSE